MDDISKTQGRTVLFVSHNMTAVRALCGSVLLLEQGQVSIHAPVEKAVEYYLNRNIPTGMDVTFKSHQHATTTGELLITRACIDNHKGEHPHELKLGEPFTVTLEFNAMTSLRQVRVGVAFMTTEGLHIATCHHTDGGRPLLDLVPGSYRLSFEIKNPFLSGTYLVSVGAHHALGFQTIDYIPDALALRVSDESFESSKQEHEPSFPGLVRLEPEWGCLCPVSAAQSAIDGSQA